MEFWPWTSVGTVFFLLQSVSAETYTLSPTAATFTDAVDNCAPGVLTSISTEQDLQQILELLDTLVPQEEVTVWVGLKKVKGDCVVLDLPLRGYKWVEDGSQETKVSEWVEEPKTTCTENRCAALRQGFLQSNTRLSLVPVRCRSSHRFICKLKDGGSPAHRPPTTPAAELAPDRRPPTTPAATPATFKPSSTAPQAHPPQPDPDAGSRPAPGSDPCRPDDIPGSRSFRLNDKNSSWIQVECWSSIKLDLFCVGQPPVWLVLDGSRANLSDLCQRCSTGYVKDTSGHCVDVDECSEDRLCPDTCLNTPGSYRCICSDHDNATGTACEVTAVGGDDGSLWDILVPVLVAVGALLVLLVLIAVTVKCCLMRRSKKRAKDKDEEEKQPMKSSQ